MEKKKLPKRLARSKLVIGEVAQTLPSFVQTQDPAPTGAIVRDLDFYSSTKQTLKLFDFHRAHVLPRTFTYFDDLIGNATVLYNEYTNVLLAISEFNKSHDEQQLYKTTYLTAGPYAETWGHQSYVYHDFMAADYCNFISEVEI